MAQGQGASRRGVCHRRIHGSRGTAEAFGGTSAWRLPRQRPQFCRQSRHGLLSRDARGTRESVPTTGVQQLAFRWSASRKERDLAWAAAGRTDCLSGMDSWPKVAAASLFRPARRQRAKWVRFAGEALNFHHHRQLAHCTSRDLAGAQLALQHRTPCLRGKLKRWSTGTKGVAMGLTRPRAETEQILEPKTQDHRCHKCPERKLYGSHEDSCSRWSRVESGRSE